MTDHDCDPVLRSLERLPLLTPDQARAERVRARCRAGFSRHRQRVEHSERVANAALLELTLVGVLCVMYLSAVVHDALRLHGLL
jgi:hypothetical protein